MALSCVVSQEHRQLDMYMASVRREGIVMDQDQQESLKNSSAVAYSGK
jgi:hypothetical protein